MRRLGGSPSDPLAWHGSDTMIRYRGYRARLRRPQVTTRRSGLGRRSRILARRDARAATRWLGRGVGLSCSRGRQGTRRGACAASIPVRLKWSSLPRPSLVGVRQVSGTRSVGGNQPPPGRADAAGYGWMATGRFVSERATDACVTQDAFGTISEGSGPRQTESGESAKLWRRLGSAWLRTRTGGARSDAPACPLRHRAKASLRPMGARPWPGSRPGIPAPDRFAVPSLRTSGLASTSGRKTNDCRT